MAMVDSVYNYYAATYGSTNVSRYDSHEKSELRDVWNNIIKLNKESPLYKLKTGDSTQFQRFVIDLKENARSISNVVASLSTDDDGLEAAFSKKVAFSSQDNVVSARYIGVDASHSNTDNFEIVVNDLAKPQINIGNDMAQDASDIASGTYTFQLTTAAKTYEFQFHVNTGDTNRSVLEKLASLIRNANIGLDAELVEHDTSAALKITSEQTGLHPEEDAVFQISAGEDVDSAVALEQLGIATTYQRAENSSFLLNGAEKSSLSNTFTINREFEVTLHNKSSSGDAVTIGFKPNVDAIADNIQELIDAYNGLIQTADLYTDGAQKTQALKNDFSQTAYQLKDQLSDIGLSVTENGTILIDKSRLSDAIQTPDKKDEMYQVLYTLKDSLSQRAAAASLDPMKYVNKIIIAYKNPGHNFATPYLTSIYSGMMLDRCC
jgi:flagellar hook-associated protein 2